MCLLQYMLHYDVMSCPPVASSVVFLDLLFTRYMILIEEDHTVSPDFLYFFSQLIPAVEKDHSLMAVSAYNDNGYSYAAQDNGLVYR